jgi:hypothetical protein
MNLANITQVGSRLVGRSVLIAQKFAPEILVGVGIIGGVTAAVWGAKATLELDSSLVYSRTMVKEHKEMRELTTEAEYPTSKYQQDIAISYYRGVQAVIKLYGPPIALGGLSIACILSAYGILRTRNTALIAAYNALEATFRRYRDRVIEDHGEETDHRYIHNLREVESETTNEKGKVVKSKELVADTNTEDLYVRTFDQRNPQWRGEGDMYNYFFLKAQQNYHNNILHTRGHVFLNEVLAALGFEHTTEGAMTGWVANSEKGDNYIDFGIFDALSAPKDFIDARAIRIEFNVDGVILGLI